MTAREQILARPGFLRPAEDLGGVEQSIVVDRLAAKEQHEMLGPRLAQRVADFVGYRLRQIDAANLGAERFPGGNDLQLGQRIGAAQRRRGSVDHGASSKLCGRISCASHGLSNCDADASARIRAHGRSAMRGVRR